jgi:hypothetical protein
MAKKKILKKGSRRQISVGVSSELHEALRQIAEKEHRSISGQAELFICSALSRKITEG